MILKIDNKEYELKFGLDFIAKMDEQYKVTDNSGMVFGAGVEYAVSYLKMENPTILRTIIKSATSYLNSKPSNDGIDQCIVEKAEAGELDNFYTEMYEAMKQSPFLRGKLTRVEKEIESQQ